MNLPVILDIIIGLIFIYLSLSLLAAEIQELIATVLQWRAEHLKKSIEVLIAGGSDQTEDPLQLERIKSLTDLLYQNPTISDLNQAAKGPLAELFRKITHRLGDLYRRMTGTQNVFGHKSSGPSYIPSESFATSLLDTLQLSEWVQAISGARLARFKDRKLAEAKLIVDDLNIDDSTRAILEQEFQRLEVGFDRVVQDFYSYNLPLENILDRLAEQLGAYTQNCQVFLPESEASGRDFQRRMGWFQESFYSEAEKKAMLAELQPSLTTLLNSVRRAKKTQETVTEILAEEEESPIYKEIKASLERLPESFKDSLYILAMRTQRKAENINQNLNQFQQEIEIWFDRAMDRASGVYKRNARGVALLIGLAIAIATNADTLYITGTLSADSVMRSAVNRYADRIVSENSLPNSENFSTIQRQVNQALERVSLPLGWNVNNLQKQEEDGKDWPQFTKRIFGWMLSGLAISMGASFWFDLLNKLVGIRNVGKVPPSTSDSSS